MAARGPRAHLCLLVLGSIAITSAIAAADARAPANGSPGTVHRPPQKTARSAPRGGLRSTAAYGRFVRAWHTPSPARSILTDATGRPLLVLASLNTNDRVALQPASDRGGFAASDLDRAATVLREPSSGNQHPIEPRLLDVAYRVQAHFQAQEIRIISAYRTARGRGSNHSRGRAIDIVVPGASDSDVAKFARELGFVGVGVYPASGFVHLDVRNRSYFWVDASGPGRRNRERGILADLAQRSDALAISRGEEVTSPFFIGSDVDAALRARGAPTQAPPTEEDEDLNADAEEGGD